MEKTEAIKLLGGTVTEAAKEVGVTPAAISLWPDVLPPRIADRVQAALWRKQQLLKPEGERAEADDAKADAKAA